LKIHWTIFARAIVRAPSANFSLGLTSSGAGAPDFDLATIQHAQYCTALRDCGLELTHLDPDPEYPDATFVEDTAVVTPRGAIITRPGAPTRRGEVDSVGVALRDFFPETSTIEAPGCLDGGDVCEADGRFLIGVSARTNEAGARQLKAHLHRFGYSATLVDIRASKALLHLKTGIAYLGDGVWVLAAEIERDLPPLADLGVRDWISVSAAEGYAANCVRVNQSVLVPAGYPRFTDALRDRGLRPMPLEMSEFQKMDGGLSCLSLRF
jgi:dimethylargininase